MNEYRLEPHAGLFAGQVRISLPGFHGARASGNGGFGGATRFPFGWIALCEV